MASEPLFDLGSIDLSKSIMRGAEIDPYLPQCGDMRMLDRVIHCEEPLDLLVGAKLARADEFWVPGHIPGRPLFPGVLMIETAAQASSFYMKRYVGIEGFLGFIRCTDVSFRGQVVPGEEFIVISKLTARNARRFVSLNQGFVKGKMVFEAQITGMTL
ncbi:MAG: beta-hydroxyacyl-ACP dehydratase [Planctomycetota bacterium]|nr:beta-hydroxyacyl-ACP dehydratase [Planctomycetota bacterium]MDA1105232.1 beta-hydroxyacyl-ACP dehydratase [Planctomycetota bacterium]